ncbi:MAG: NYN domain-containing protein [Gammaproteobacteria bacterium]|nr:NYN domain-containing protein [Gammaproteobacteria bacterium]CAJ2376775.1 MAG: NYN domain-containing protein [Arenicellales bacterium IbO2]MDA7961355.1 NYN domain-containing protein [Gammaproteobacteria bacterium]MDA7968674.1 NYN domain-containing protein [Gammaproteobacteria bacterium]MDA7969452.1 NYN domain-containing protein [Gammaproteobacteria bacterium]
MEKVFIYLDNSNIYISARGVAAERGDADGRAQVRLDFRNLLQLAHADRPISRAVAVGSIPPELRDIWKSLERQDVKVRLSHRTVKGKEVGVDEELQNNMLRDVCDHESNPGTAVLLSGDGGFRADLERMHNKGWRVEVLAWEHSCHRQMKEWARDNGKFTALEDYYDHVTFAVKPRVIRRAKPLGAARHPA